jgi:outer membrane protein assembly factor BamA
MKVQIKPQAQIYDESATVHYDINISEGDLYKMGELEIAGVDSSSKDRLREAWTLREGDPYNANYTRKFVDDAPRLLPRGLQFSVKLDEELDEKSKAVDVTIHFKVQ